MAADVLNFPANKLLRTDQTMPPAAVILNADDWGLERSVTNRILECLRAGAISSASAMMFMPDSERAAGLAAEHYVDAGLHLNLDAPFSAANVSAKLREEQEKIAGFLRSSRFAGVVFHPFLMNAFEYVARTQIDEYVRLYGTTPTRFDGHHHFHLSANVVWQKLLPAGAIVRRNFTFGAGDKSAMNRWYRGRQDARLARRHAITDYLFNLVPVEDAERLRRILELARRSNVELETHPAVAGEYDFLMRGGLQRLAENVVIVRGYQLRSQHQMSAPAASFEQRAMVPEIATGTLPHICVCICTYKRPEMLKRLLRGVDAQETGGQFTVSVVVADNDPEGSARTTVQALQRELRVPLKYCAEPRRGIARARNKVVSNATGDYLAWIDDDEFPVADWLLKLYTTCRRYGVDGVLGPVRRSFDQEPPAWLKRSRLYDRRVNPTGKQVEWKESRTGNVLIRRDVMGGEPEPFRVEFRAGEDQDFFRRKIAEGRRFVWSSDAAAYEVVPPARWKRMYYVRKALFQGATSNLHGNIKAVLKSIVAVPLYTLGLPFALLTGQHRFMTLLVKLCDHAGRLLHALHIQPIRDEYVSE
jgi:glycosyltransferase involved in cell wall biosynthesis